MVSEPVAGAVDLDDDGMVQQPVEERGGDDGVAEDLAPFGEATVGGKNHRPLLIARPFGRNQKRYPERDPDLTCGDNISNLTCR